MYMEADRLANESAVEAITRESPGPGQPRPAPITVHNLLVIK